MPAPLKARMVSSMSATKAASCASKRATGCATARSSGSPIFSTGRTAMGVARQPLCAGGGSPGVTAIEVRWSRNVSTCSRAGRGAATAASARATASVTR